VRVAIKLANNLILVAIGVYINVGTSAVYAKQLFILPYKNYYPSLQCFIVATEGLKEWIGVAFWLTVQSHFSF
jgi:hypothetical protein